MIGATRLGVSFSSFATSCVPSQTCSLDGQTGAGCWKHFAPCSSFFPCTGASTNGGRHALTTDPLREQSHICLQICSSGNGGSVGCHQPSLPSEPAKQHARGQHAYTQIHVLSTHRMRKSTCSWRAVCDCTAPTFSEMWGLCLRALRRSSVSTSRYAVTRNALHPFSSERSTC